MAVWKRYNGKKIKPTDPNWDKGTWIVEFKLRSHRVLKAIPEARTQKQAEQVETNIKQAIFDRKYNKASGVTRFTDFFDNVFVPWAKENKRSWKDDKQRGLRLKVFFKEMLLRDITPLLIEKFKIQLKNSDSKFKRKFSPSTVNRYLTVLSKVLSIAVENGILDANPTQHVTFLREPGARERYLNQHANDEETRLINALGVYGEHLIALAEFDLQVGMRLGELLKSDISYRNRLIKISETKTDKPRVVPLNNRAMAILAKLRQDAPDYELIFDPVRTGRHRRQLMVCFERAVTASGIGDFHFHDLRHTFATRLRAANVHPYDIADLLGHSVPEGETRNTRVTRGYAHAIPQRLRDAVDSLERGKLLTFGTSTLHQQKA